MVRKVFYSFHYKPDSWRAAKVRNIGTLEGNQPAKDNDWESIKAKGDAAIQAWIDGQLLGKSCAVVLIGTETAARPWVQYEIKKAWNDGKGVVGIYIHKLTDHSDNQASKGPNPFDRFKIGDAKMSSIVKAYDSASATSPYVYDDISKNLAGLVEQAIEIRANYSQKIA